MVHWDFGWNESQNNQHKTKALAHSQNRCSFEYILGISNGMENEHRNEILCSWNECAFNIFSVHFSCIFFFLLSVFHFQWYCTAVLAFKSIWTILFGMVLHFFGISEQPKETNTKLYSFVVCYFHVIPDSIAPQKFVSLFFFFFLLLLVVLFISPLVKAFRVIYGWCIAIIAIVEIGARTNFFHCSGALRWPVYRMVFIGYLNTHVEINKKYDSDRLSISEMKVDDFFFANIRVFRYQEYVKSDQQQQKRNGESNIFGRSNSSIKTRAQVTLVVVLTGFRPSSWVSIHADDEYDGVGSLRWWW